MDVQCGKGRSLRHAFIYDGDRGGRDTLPRRDMRRQRRSRLRNSPQTLLFVSVMRRLSRGRNDRHEGGQESHHSQHCSLAGWKCHESSLHSDDAHRVRSSSLRTGIKEIGASLLVTTCCGGGRPGLWPPREVFCAPAGDECWVCRGSRRGGCLPPHPHPHAAVWLGQVSQAHTLLL
jgi:hypothetical protein